MTQTMAHSARVSSLGNLFLGIDGGGSTTLAVVVDADGHERGRGTASGANYRSVGIEQAIANLWAAAGNAVEQAGATFPIARAWVGLAGVDRPVDLQLFLPRLMPYLARAVHLTNDAELVLSALEHAVGIAVISGTGSIVLGRDASGTTARVGGWGHLVGDEGSGYDVGRSALQAAVQAADGRGQPTKLLPQILKHWGLRCAEDILAQVYPAGDKAILADLAPLVFAAASAGDAAARAIVRRAAVDLALAAHAVARKLPFPNSPPPVALGGGLLLHQEAFRRQVVRRLQRRMATGPIVVAEQPDLSAARAMSQGIEPGMGSGMGLGMGSGMGSSSPGSLPVEGAFQP